MNIYQELNLIDDYEASFGNEAACARACDLMVDYLSILSSSAKPILVESLSVALAYRKGHASRADLRVQEERLNGFISDNRISITPVIPEHCLALSVRGVLASFRDPHWGGGASELVSNFLDMTDGFERNHRAFVALLREHFAFEADASGARSTIARE